LRFLDFLRQRVPLSTGNFAQCGAQLGADVVFSLLRRKRNGVVIVDPVVLLPAGNVAGNVAELLAALVEQLPKLGHPPPLVGVPGNGSLELVQLLAGEPPLAIVSAPAGIDIFVERIAADRGLRSGNAGVDRPGEERHVIGMALGLQRFVARSVGHRDQHDHAQQEQGRDEGDRSGPAPAPVETLVFPGRHDASVTVGICG